MIHQHGGDLNAIEKQYHIPKKEIIDFSGNINPFGFPASVKKSLVQNLDILSVYPDKNYTTLRKAIANYTGADFEHIVVGNGSTELISTFIKTTQAQQTLIVGPAYSEYEREAELCGSNYHYFALEEKDHFCINLPKLLTALTSEIGLFILCNPNNPTGTVVSTKQLEKIVEHCKTNNTAVMIDETYMEFCDNLEQYCAIPLTKKFDNLFVIRGTSKFFAAPGLRLGYAVSSNETFLKTLKQYQDPWSVNSIAAFAGELLFSDKQFIQQTKELISTERKRCITELKKWKHITVYDSSSNFILLKLQTNKIDSHQLFEILIQKKLLIRDASSFTFLDDTFLRFCILLPEQNTYLLKELKTFIE